MTDRYETLAARLDERFGEKLTRVESTCGELTYEVDKDDLHDVSAALRGELGFEMLMDVCGVDYLSYGSDEWNTRIPFVRAVAQIVDTAHVHQHLESEFTAQRGGNVVQVVLVDFVSQLAARRFDARELLTEALVEPSSECLVAICHSRLFLSGNRARASDLLLQLDQAVDQRLGGWRATGNVDVDRHDAIASAHDRIGIVVIAAAVGA